MKIIDKVIYYDDKWARNRGRIYIDLPYSLDNEKMFEYVKEFIGKTIDKIHKEING